MVAQIGYLSWALKCHQRVEEYLVDRTGLPDQVKQMASVWSRYVDNLDKGVRSVGLDNLFYNGDDDDSVPARKLNKMIVLIDEAVPDYQARFKNPNSVTTPNPVVIRGRRWPNIVAFARSIGNEAVEEIKSIERDINVSTGGLHTPGV